MNGICILNEEDFVFQLFWCTTSKF